MLIVKNKSKFNRFREFFSLYLYHLQARQEYFCISWQLFLKKCQDYTLASNYAWIHVWFKRELNLGAWWKCRYEHQINSNKSCKKKTFYKQFARAMSIPILVKQPIFPEIIATSSNGFSTKINSVPSVIQWRNRLISIYQADIRLPSYSYCGYLFWSNSSPFPFREDLLK